jgi:hypothetical protein
MAHPIHNSNSQSALTLVQPFVWRNSKVLVHVFLGPHWYIQNSLGWRHSVKLRLTPGYMARISCRRRTQRVKTRTMYCVDCDNRGEAYCLQCKAVARIGPGHRVDRYLQGFNSRVEERCGRRCMYRMALIWIIWKGYAVWTPMMPRKWPKSRYTPLAVVSRARNDLTSAARGR